MIQLDDNYFMKQALVEAEKAFAEGEVPVGAVVVANEKIIARAYNQTERLNDFTAHAEMIALTSASNFLGSKYLDNCVLYVTLEPCPMCASALHWCRVQKIFFGAYDEKKGASLFSPSLHHKKTQLTGGLMQKESEALLQDFFQRKRASKT